MTDQFLSYPTGRVFQCDAWTIEDTTELWIMLTDGKYWVRKAWLGHAEDCAGPYDTLEVAKVA